jgi:hypothetical protein
MEYLWFHYFGSYPKVPLEKKIYVALWTWVHGTSQSSSRWNYHWYKVRHSGIALVSIYTCWNFWIRNNVIQFLFFNKLSSNCKSPHISLRFIVVAGPLLVLHLTCMILGFLQWHKTTSWKLNMMIILQRMPALLPSVALLLLLWVLQFIHAGAYNHMMHNMDCLFIHNICLSFCVQLMALLLLRHALTLTYEDDDDTSAMFSVSEITPLEMGF